MFETTKYLLIVVKRDLFKKIKDSPFLYFLFIVMMLFSIVMFAALTMLMTRSDMTVSLDDVFFTVFFVFMLKAASDTHTHYITSTSLSYALSTDNKHNRVAGEVLLMVMINELTIWFILSIAYLLSAWIIYGINIYYPVEYFLFTLGVVSASMIGSTLSMYFFSPCRIRLLPSMILLALYVITRSMYAVVLTLPVALMHLVWCLKNSWYSYLFIRHEKREQESSNAKKRSIVSAFFYRETTTLWRDRLLPSFVLASVMTAVGAGYMIHNGVDILPEFMRDRLKGFLPSLFLFVGVYITILYTSVFPSLVLFLNEDKTMWILRNLPLTTDTIVHGKASSLLLCFLSSVPFISYISIFIDSDELIYLIWFFIFSYLLGVIVALPLSAKYMGKKSDVLLLYSIAMVLFILLGLASSIGEYIYQYVYPYNLVVLSLIILLELITLSLSFKISAGILDMKNPVKEDHV